MCRFVGEEPLDHPGTISAVMKVVGDAFMGLDLPPEALFWEIVTPLLRPPADLARMLDSNEQARLIVEDRSEQQPAHAHPGSYGGRLEALEGLSREGFGVPVRIPTAFPEDLPKRVTRWLKANEDCGVHLVPQLSPTYRGGPAARIADEADLERAAAVFREITPTISPIAHVCEPWRTHFVAAVSSGWSSVIWDTEHSRIHLAADGRWARSAEHGARGAWGSLAELQPLVEEGAALRRSASQAPHGAGTDGWPGCPSCGYAPLCNRYWSPAGDAALRAGDVETASLAARLECSLRMITLAALLDEWRREGRGRSYAGATRLSFDEGRVTYSSE